jgi:hypothetical protein
MNTIPARLALLSVLLGGCAESAPTGVPDAGAPAMSMAPSFPPVIALPDGFWPEGIAFGRGTTYYVGSLATGAIWRGDARTGTGDLLVAEQPGVEMVGIHYDTRGNRLFVAGGFSGQAFVYDADSGALLASYELGAAGMSLVNDVVVTPGAAYFTDSFNDVLYRIPLTAGGLPSQSGVETIVLGGDWESVESDIGNANGIVATPDGRYLLIVNTTTGLLYRVDARTGEAREIDVGAALYGGDGLLLVGHTLYVVLGFLNEIAEVRLSPDFLGGSIVGALTSPYLRFPSTIALHGNCIYAVNARFDEPYEPSLEYEVVAVRR